MSKKKPIPSGLKPFQPGVSGNPNGRPKGTFGVKKRFELALKVLNYPLRHISPRAFNELKKMFPSLSNDITVDEALMIQILNSTLNEKTISPVVAHKFIREEAYGRLPEGEEPDPPDTEEKLVFNISIGPESLKSDKIE